MLVGPLINQTIGEYRLVERIGSGGMGEIYRAIHPRLGREAAVKVLRLSEPGLMASERFLNEARIQASLRHPNIALLYELRDIGGCPCIIMEYVDGETLQALIHRTGGLEVSHALRLFAVIVETIGYLHAHGIIHRDIKPNNIKLSSQSEVKLLDFGIAKSPTSERLTREGGVIGTVQYLAPEQIKGQPATTQSDIWALGVLLYEMLTGHLVFEADSWGEICQRITSAVYTPLAVYMPSVPKEIESITSRCLRKNPSHRYASVKTLLAEVNALPCCDAPMRSADPRDIHSSIASKIKEYWAILSIPVLLFFLGGWYVVAPSISKDVPKQPEPATERKQEAPNMEPAVVTDNMRSVNINVYGPADLYLHDGMQWTGPYKTPYKFTVPQGSLVKYRVERVGFQSKEDSFNVRSNTTFTLTLCPVGAYCPE